MYLCGAHYRQPVEFDDERLDEAQARCTRIIEAGRALIDGPSPDWSPPLRERFFDALAADFNTPRALAVAFDWVRDANRSASGTVGNADLRAMLDLLGLANLLDLEQVQTPPEALELLHARDAARAARDFSEADRLRDALRELGWVVRDGPDGPQLLRAP
jgi:cysteinyl-tRNA synthetase